MKKLDVRAQIITIIDTMPEYQLQGHSIDKGMRHIPTLRSPIHSGRE